MTKANLSLNDIMIGSIPDHVAYGDVFTAVENEIDKEVDGKEFTINFNEVHKELQDVSKEVRMYSWKLHAKTSHDAIHKFVSIMMDILSK